MNNKRPTAERSYPGNFDLKPLPDRERGHVLYEYGGRDYDWFMFPDGRVVLVNGNEKDSDIQLLEAMKLQVRSILKPELKK